jgi:hypothetical protein
MAKYFIDTEFIEDFTHPWFGKSRHYIDLISIAIVSEDGREYYAVSNQFDIDHVWNKFQIETWMPENSVNPNEKCGQIIQKKVYWLRDNVLMPIFYELSLLDWEIKGAKVANYISLADFKADQVWSNDLWRFKKLIQKHGKHKNTIVNEISYFVGKGLGQTEFYGYYADYDWVLLCSLFGRMLDLPREFPMYCNDLKQTLEENNNELRKREPIGDLEQCDFHSVRCVDGKYPPQYQWHQYQDHNNYPKQLNSHNALDDARWNKQLYDFLKTV